MRAVALAVCLAGCIGSVGTSPPPSDSSTSADDGHVDARVILWPDSTAGSASMEPCVNRVNPAPQNGHHNPGKSCFQSCHNHGFSLAGTLYTNATGNTGYAGATISVIDANSKALDLVVSSNGNFYTSESLALPVLVLASACPYSVKMVGSTPSGDCNKSGCHVGATNAQMHLP